MNEWFSLDGHRENVNDSLQRMNVVVRVQSHSKVRQLFVRERKLLKQERKLLLAFGLVIVVEVTIFQQHVIF